METNKELDLAYRFLQYTGTNVFLTGKAGTGKTTFLQQLKTKSPKRMVVLAPTGVAAINAGGVTIHSFFQLPFGPYVPGQKAEGTTASNRYSHRFGREKIDVIRSIDLLVIDEISMVRADLLDAVSDMLWSLPRPEPAFRRCTIVTDRGFATTVSGGKGRGMGFAESIL